MKRIILASTSPRRKELLKILFGTKFQAVESAYEEDNTLNIKPEELVKKHALSKARSVAKKFKDSDSILVGCDTVVVFENKAIGKPTSAKNAVKILQKISNKKVFVISGVAVLDTKSGKELVDSVTTIVKMKKMTDKEIQEYVKSGEPLDKAGAFGIQGKGAILVEEIKGCYFNVVGLPLYKLNSMLEDVGVSVFDYK